jgi:hypothetical protein
MPDLHVTGFPLQPHELFPEIRVDDRLVLPRQPISVRPDILRGIDIFGD